MLHRWSMRRYWHDPVSVAPRVCPCLSLCLILQPLVKTFRVEGGGALWCIRDSQIFLIEGWKIVLTSCD